MPPHLPMPPNQPTSVPRWLSRQPMFGVLLRRVVEPMRSRPVASLMLAAGAIVTFVAFAQILYAVVTKGLNLLPFIPASVTHLADSWPTALRWFFIVLVGWVSIQCFRYVRAVYQYARRANIPKFTAPHADLGALDYFEVLVPASNRFREMLAADVLALPLVAEALGRFLTGVYRHERAFRASFDTRDALRSALVDVLGPVARDMVSQTDSLGNIFCHFLRFTR